MDTRDKVKTLSQSDDLLAHGRWTIVIGYFDPLTVEHATCLHQLVSPETKLMAVIAIENDDLLPAMARAALVASLRDVDAVVADEAEWRLWVTGHADSLTGHQVIDRREEDRLLRSQFERHVLRRQAMPVAPSA